MSSALLQSQSTRPETDSLEQLELHLQRQLRGRVRDFRLVHTGRGLTLRGYSSTYYAKQIAQQAVLEATTLPLISNDICVL